MKLKIISICIMFLMFSNICFCSELIKKKEFVDAIYWHENDRFTAVKVVDKVVQFISLPRQPVTVTVVCDADEKPWYEYSYQFSDFAGAQKGGWCKIHIKTVDSLRSADWNHGKFGSGSTVRIDK